MEKFMAIFVAVLCLCVRVTHAQTFEEQVSAASQTAYAALQSARKVIASTKSQRPGTASDPAYVAECRAVGYSKLESQAVSFGIKVDMKTFRLSGRDERAENPSKYLWWSVDVTDVNGRTDVFPPDAKPVLTKATQKYLDKPCF